MHGPGGAGAVPPVDDGRLVWLRPASDLDDDDDDDAAMLEGENAKDLVEARDGVEAME